MVTKDNYKGIKHFLEIKDKEIDFFHEGLGACLPLEPLLTEENLRTRGVIFIGLFPSDFGLKNLVFSSNPQEKNRRHTPLACGEAHLTR
jgi:hypothetical protein